jgi:DNA-binding CsgD family transcriptional regulator
MTETSVKWPLRPTTAGASAPSAIRDTPRSRQLGVRSAVAVLAAFLVIALLAAFDLASDLRDGVTIGHALAEGGAFAVAFAGAVLVARRLQAIAREARAARQEAGALARRLQATEAEAARWRDEARDVLAGLGAALDRQFARWGLSPAEKETALLLLKGLSHKEIAEVRSITEATARQQARSVYRKAGLAGRHDLAAYFLEDLLLPPGSGVTAR